MISIVPKHSCVGCGACMSVCPVDAVKMLPDGEGFLYPSVDEKSCTKCEECLNVCPALNEKKFKRLEKPGVWSARTLDDHIRINSSSGGIFYELANHIINNNGIVYGAAFDASFKLQHKAAVKNNEVFPLMGSKYVQSEIKKVFAEVENALQSDRYVLFSGTPCQVAGLYTFLQKDYSHLFTCDVICHGVASPAVFSSYLRQLEEDHESKVNIYKFRTKPFGWRNFYNYIEFENGLKISEPFADNTFMKGYLANIYLRPSCYYCKYSRIPRVADISMGDFWRIWDYKPEWDDGKGLTALLVNSYKGHELFDLMHFEKKEADLQWVISGNPSLTESARLHRKRGYFFRLYSKGVHLDEILKICNPSPSICDKIAWSIKRRIKKFAK